MYPTISLRKAISRHHGRRDGGRVLCRGHVRDRGHGPHDPSGLRGISNLAHSGRSADEPNKHQDRVDVPSVPQPSGSGGGRPGPSIPSTQLYSGSS